MAVVDPVDPHAQEHHLTMAGDDRLSPLEDRLGHRFANRALYEQALTSNDVALLETFQKAFGLGG